MNLPFPTITQFSNTNLKLTSLIKKTSEWKFFLDPIYIYDNMKSDKLKNQVLSIFEEIKQDKQTDLQLEGLKGAYAKLAKFLLQQVKAGKFLRNYDIEDNAGRMVFQTF